MIYIVIGADGSGKSTWISDNRQENSIVLSSDELRGVIGQSDNDQSVTPIVFKTLQKFYVDFLRIKRYNDFDLYVDATNLNKKDRKFYIDQANRFNLAVTAISFEVDLDTLVDRNKTRGQNGGRNVPLSVLQRMLAKYEPPMEAEGFKLVRYMNDK